MVVQRIPTKFPHGHPRRPYTPPPPSPDYIRVVEDNQVKRVRAGSNPPTPSTTGVLTRAAALTHGAPANTPRSHPADPILQARLHKFQARLRKLQPQLDFNVSAEPYTNTLHTQAGRMNTSYVPTVDGTLSNQVTSAAKVGPLLTSPDPIVDGKYSSEVSSAATMTPPVQHTISSSIPSSATIAAKKTPTFTSTRQSTTPYWARTTNASTFLGKNYNCIHHPGQELQLHPPSWARTKLHPPSSRRYFAPC